MLEKRGGRREGAGRKLKPGEKPKDRATIGIEPDLNQWLNEVTDNKTEYINSALRLAKDQNLVIVRTEKFEKDYGKPTEAFGNWVFVIQGKNETFAGTYSTAKESAIAAALAINTRFVVLTGYELVGQ